MNRRTFLRMLPVVAMGLMSIPQSASALVVFDPSNFTQNIMTAIRTLQSNINEATMVANQVQSLTNQARNLTNLPFSVLNQFRSQFTELFRVVGAIQGLAGDFANLESRFEDMYPDFSKQNGPLSGKAVSDTVGRWLLNNRNTMQGAAKTGAAVLSNLPQNQTDLETLIAGSQGASGALDAMQAGNQIAAQVAGQLMSLNAQMATYQQAHVAYLMAQNQSAAAAQKRAGDVMRDWGKNTTHNPARGYGE